MSEIEIIGYGADGQPIFSPEFTEDELQEKLKASAEWQSFSAKFDMQNAENRQLLTVVFEQRLEDDAELADYKTLLSQLLQAGGSIKLSEEKSESGEVIVTEGVYSFVRKPVAASVVEAEVPRDRNGKPLSASQIAWSEYRQFAEGHTMDECRARARGDLGFASFMKKNYQREAGETESVQFQLAGQTPGDRSKATPELIAFANEFRTLNMDQVRARKSPVLNPLGHTDFINKVEACLVAGLI